MADALDSGSSSSKTVCVKVSSPAPIKNAICDTITDGVLSMKFALRASEIAPL